MVGFNHQLVYHEPPRPWNSERFWPPKNQMIYHKNLPKNAGFGGQGVSMESETSPTWEANDCPICFLSGDFDAIFVPNIHSTEIVPIWCCLLFLWIYSSLNILILKKKRQVRMCLPSILQVLIWCCGFPANIRRLATSSPKDLDLSIPWKSKLTIKNIGFFPPKTDYFLLAGNLNHPKLKTIIQENYNTPL